MDPEDTTPLFAIGTYTVNKEPNTSNQQPKFNEIGTTSAPLTSAAFFIGDHCGLYNNDFMLCKTENADPHHCLLEGRKVTRCAMDVLAKLKSNCNASFKKHWECLDAHNHELHKCRAQERHLNACALHFLNWKKFIPDTPEHEPPIHLKPRPLYY